jgi:apolipoprotein N-acyltransferase
VRARTPEWPDITQGAGTRLLIDGPLRITPLICYEDLLADYVGAAARRGPNLLVTLANHAWFGSSAAPQQALALATLRAIETRRDLVRATNTGVSSIGDALGRVTQVGPLYGVAPNRPRPATVIVGDVALLDGFALGPFSVPVFPWVCAAALLAVAVFARRRIGGGEASGAPTAGDGRSA